MSARRSSSPSPFPSLFLFVGIFVFCCVPASYFLADVLTASNEVHISAVVPDTSSGGDTGSGSSPSSSVSSGGVAFVSGGGHGSGSGATDNGGSTNTGGETHGSGGGNGSNEAGTGTTDAGQNASDSGQVSGTEPPSAPSTTTVHFGGHSFPNATVTFTVNGSTISQVTADSTGYFQGSYDTVSLGENVFSFQAQDGVGNQSHLVSYMYTVSTVSPVVISSVLLPPTFSVQNTGDLGGTSIPGSVIQVYGLDSATQSLNVVGTAEVQTDGTYVYNFDFSQGEHYDQYYVSCTWKGTDCGYSSIVQVQTVGDSNKFIQKVFADFTEDVHVNYADFAFIRAAFLSGKVIPFYDLSQDGKIDLADFALLNYQWSL